MILSKFTQRFLGAILVCAFLIAFSAARHALSQNMSTGAVAVTVQDPAGAAVNGAQLELKDTDTNSTRTATTQKSGTATFPDLNFGHYSLTITKAGFATKIYSMVLVQTNQITPINAKLSVGNVSQRVTVSAESSPILDTTSNVLSTTVDLKQVQNLPVLARDTFPLSFLVPGAALGGNGYPGDVDFNNLPGGALNASMNGFSNETQRNKTEGFDYNTPVAVGRLEDVQEMTVQTGELDASKGGTAAMDIGVVTKRGTNKFHGLLFWDYRNDAMNANSWENNAEGIPRAKLIIDDFGGSVGGPILKDKLFFFASLANYRQPLKATVSTEVATPRALSGIYEYYPQGSNNVQSINVLQAAASGGCSTCSGTINPDIQTELKNIESTYNLAGATLTPLDLNHDTLNFLAKEYVVQKYPTARVDYNLSQNFHLVGSANESAAYDENTGPGPYPGPIFANQTTSGITKGYQIVAGFDWTIKPNVVNAFRAGYLYNGFTFNSQGVGAITPGMSEQIWGFGLNSGINAFNNLKGGQLYPVLSIKDDTTWQHGAHTISFGGEISTEIDHYYNQPLGFPEYSMNAIASGDPAATALNSAIPANAPASVPGDTQALYATLTGRINLVQQPEFLNIYTGQYGINGFNLHERLTNSALFFEDSWKVNSELTLNYGLRWDFIGASKDETGAYTSPTIAALWGPSGVNGLFDPGNLPGDKNPVLSPNAQPYSPSYIQPQPNFGFAWNPQGTEGLLGRLLGGGKNVFRGSYTFKNYTEGAQNFWNFASDNGFNYNPSGVLQPAPGVIGKGFFEPGTLNYGNPLPPILLSPATYQPVVTEASVTFNNGGFLAFNPHIKQPWVESWALGIQHQFDQNNVLEVRYVGNVSRDQWLGVNYDEINIFENGFLSEFQKAQNNLAASGGTSFQGPQPLPIMSTAFASAGGNSNFSNGQFATYLQQGQAGAFANALATNAGYLCSLVGAANFSPCAANGASGTGTYPINFWQANPYGAGSGIYEMTNDGYSNYNSLQTDFRQRPTHGMQFDVNYTFAHSLTMNQQRSTTPGYYSSPAYYTLRDKHRNYGPSVYDIRHVLHVSGTYDLPFGRGREFLNQQNRLVDAVIGGWTLGTILTYQSGPPMLFIGGTETVNTSDSGVVLTGVTPSQLQHAIGIHPVPGIPRVSYIDPKYINANGQANTQYISPEFTAGQFGRVLYLYGPKFITTDMELSKTIPIRGDVNFQVQAAAFNVFNHPAWSVGSNGLPSNGALADTGVQDNTFGTISGAGSTTVSQPRNLEIRANLRF